MSIIPKPLEMRAGDGAFRLSESTRILFDAASEEARGVAGYLAERIHQAAGFDLIVEGASESGTQTGALLLATAGADASLGDEGYTLDVDGQSVVVRGKPAGLFYGVQSLLQLMPAEVYSSSPGSPADGWQVPAVHVKDSPRFSWRGMHLDVCRHFFPVEFVKRFIDYLALHKMNVFHWHLTEDQGWRIEIKKYPKLTEISAFRKGTQVAKTDKHDGVRYGGFYTQDQVREVVAYAKERFVTVVPEIELPGHSVAALAAYPHLSCTGGPFEVRTQWGISRDIYCAGNDSSFAFLENVLTEVLELFPSEYIHIGGDEAPKQRWSKCEKCQQRIKDEGLKDEHELQSYFIKRIEKFLNGRGRRLIGWDEILEGGLAPQATVMSWRGMAGGIAAAKQNHDVVMTPTSYCYFDYYQGDASEEPLAIGGFLPLEKVYEFDPIPGGLMPTQARHILGAQGNVWTEFIPTTELVEYMSLPRMSALAEVVWSPKEQRDLDDFIARMAGHYARLARMKANYRQPDLIGLSAQNVFIDQAVVDIRAPRPDGVVRYTIDGTEPTQESPTFARGPIRLTQSTLLAAQEFLPDGTKGPVKWAKYEKQKPAAAKAVEKTSPGLKYDLFKFDHLVKSTLELDAMTPVDQSVANKFEVPFKEPAENFGLKFTGFIDVPAEGVYTFTTASDDGSRLYIGYQLVVDNDGLHGAREKSGQIALAAGLHPIWVTFFQAGGGESLEVHYEGPGIEEQVVPAEVLVH